MKRDHTQLEDKDIQIVYGDGPTIEELMEEERQHRHDRQMRKRRKNRRRRHEEDADFGGMVRRG